MALNECVLQVGSRLVRAATSTKINYSRCFDLKFINFPPDRGDARKPYNDHPWCPRVINVRLASSRNRITRRFPTIERKLIVAATAINKLRY